MGSGGIGTVIQTNYHLILLNFTYTDNGFWREGPPMVEKRGYFTLNTVGDVLGR